MLVYIEIQKTFTIFLCNFNSFLKTIFIYFQSQMSSEGSAKTQRQSRLVRTI